MNLEIISRIKSRLNANNNKKTISSKNSTFQIILNIGQRNGQFTKCHAIKYSQEKSNASMILNKKN